MVRAHLCERNASTLYIDGWFDTYRYRYVCIGFSPRAENAQCYIIARRYRLIDIARRDYDNFEVAEVYW